MHRKFVLSAAALCVAVALACGKHSPAPTSPSGAQSSDASAAADGSTLKVPAPAPQSPINNAQPDTLVLTTGKVTGKYDTSINPSYEFEIKTSSGTTVPACSGTVPPGSGSTVSYTPTCQLEFDSPYTWRARAVWAGAFGPWSAAAAFKSPLGGYINGNEIYDPLTNGKTVGIIRGPTQFVPGVGLKLIDHESHVLYKLPTNLQQGEFSMMILGADEGSEGDKSKVFAMQEGPDENDITDDDYRMTAELRGRNHPVPGAVNFRIIFGDAISIDADRAPVNFDSTRWYFWRFTWRTGQASLTVRRDGPSGQVVFSSTKGSGTHPYRPDPHYLYLGSPAGRAGLLDATLPGGVYKNIWASSRPRPTFPGE